MKAFLSTYAKDNNQDRGRKRNASSNINSQSKKSTADSSGT